MPTGPPKASKPDGGAFLEELLEDLLAQKIYAVEFAHAFSRFDEWLGRLTVRGHGFEDELSAALTSLVNRLRQAAVQARTFVESADLGRLDQALGLARAVHAEAEELETAHPQHASALSDFLHPSWPADSDFGEHWSTRVQRHRGLSRATFRCRTCGWELTYTAETDAADPLELPFDDFTCPFCDPELAEEATGAAREGGPTFESRGHEHGNKLD